MSSLVTIVKEAMASEEIVDHSQVAMFEISPFCGHAKDPAPDSVLTSTGVKNRPIYGGRHAAGTAVVR